MKLFLIARSFIYNSSYYLGKLIGINKNMVTIVCYHSFQKDSNRYAVSVGDFVNEVKKLQRSFEFISIKEIFNSSSSKKAKLLFTIDDGYEDVLKILPIVRKYQIPITLFVLSNPEHADRKELHHQGKLLSTEQIKTFVKEGWTIGCHSATHADFSKLSDEQIYKEVVESKKILEKKLGIPIKYFAYPKGFYNDKILQAVYQAGYKAAFSVKAHSVNINSNYFDLPRVVVDATHDLSEFPAILSETTFLLRRISEKLHLWNLLEERKLTHAR